MKKKNKYWYKTDVYECVLCGRQPEYKIRVYDNKPKFSTVWHQDVCPTHFI